MNLRVPHPSRVLRRVGSYDLKASPSVLLLTLRPPSCASSAPSVLTLSLPPRFNSITPPPPSFHFSSPPCHLHPFRGFVLAAFINKERCTCPSTKSSSSAVSAAFRKPASPPAARPSPIFPSPPTNPTKTATASARNAPSGTRS